MEWFSGDVAQCVKKVKSDKKLFLVFSEDESDLSKQISEALDMHDITAMCCDIICLKLQTGSTPFIQFCSFYPPPSLPCIHLISPLGEVLSIKATDFSHDQISKWLQDNIKEFHKVEEMKIADEKFQNNQVSEDKLIEISDDKVHENKQKDKKITPSSVEQKLPVAVSSQENTDTRQSQLSLSMEEKVEYAKRLLEEKQNAKAVEEFQKAHEEELKRRELGRNLTEFRRMQREREIQERIEEQKREKAEKEATRRQILAQIEADRRERKSAPTSKPTVFDRSSLEKKSTLFDPDEVRLQIRLPDGAHMVGVFSADAHLGEEVREFIAARVKGVEITAYSGVTVPPLSEAMRASFASIVSTGYSFRQTRPPPLRNFSPEDETSKTLRDLGLWPSSVLILHANSTPYSRSKSSLPEYSQNIISYVFGLVWNGIRGAGDVVYYFGDGLISAGQSVWRTLFGGGVRNEHTVGRRPGERQESRSSASEEKEDGRAYRRQGKISRLSHMPDDTDEQARWNGNSTTQL